MGAANKHKNRRRPFNLVAALAWADLKHESLLSWCMILAIASIVAPLLILFGLKFGTIETMQQRLLDDPKNREIRPLTSRSYEPAWFAETVAWPQTAFVIPYTRQISASIEAYKAAAGEEPPPPPKPLDVVPTADGDPVLASGGYPAPADGQAVLTAPAAEMLGVKTGGRLVLVAKRAKGSRLEPAKTEVEITGVLPLGANPNKAVYLPLSALENIENYKDGRAVPEYGWPGENPLAYPVFTQMLLALDSPLGPEKEFMVINNTGFVEVDKITEDNAARLTGAGLKSGVNYYLLKTKGSPARATNIKIVESLLEPGGRLFPLADPLEATLSPADGSFGQVVAVRPFSALTPEASQVLSSGLAESKPWREIMVSADFPFVGAAQFILKNDDGQSLKFPIVIKRGEGGPASGQAAAPLPLLGVLALSRIRPVYYDAASDTFMLDRRGYAGFRLYAASLQDVAVLKGKLESQGIEVSTEEARIDEVMRLDKYLSLIFWLIAGGAMVGGVASLVSNVYAGIERKRKSLAMLRLLGFSGFAFMRYPLYSSLIITFGGFILSVALFFSLSHTINYLFADHLRAGESLCRLGWMHLGVALSVTISAALLAGLLAARRAYAIEPAEALRDE